MDILIASQNQHKIEEISLILKQHQIFSPENSLDIPEGSVSYIENALIKAQAWQTQYPDYYILADDSGIEIEVLDNAPGVISADWAGEKSSSEALVAKTLEKMKNIPTENRCAKFVSIMLLLTPKNQIFVSRGECYGRIALEAVGTQGFGYDSLFLPVEYQYQKSMAELSIKDKNKISHRKKALFGICDYLKYLEDN